MKKQFVFMALVLVCILLSGCLKMENAVTLNADGSGEFVLTVGVLKEAEVDEMIDGASEQYVGKEGYTVKPYEDDKYRGYVISKNFASPDEFNQIINNFGESDEDTYILKDVKMEDAGGKIVIRGPVAAMEDSEADGMESAMAAMMVSTMDISFKVKPEGKVLNHNATSVENGTYIWKLDPTKYSEISFEMEKAQGASGMNKTALIIVAVVSLGLAAVLGGFAFYLKNKNK